MTTLAKIDANRKNGKLSTGPKTAKGKAAAKMNAVTHGLRSLSPVLPDERPKDWNDHRAGIVAALAPVGTLETELVERVALLMWRLRRVVRYETAVTAAGIDERGRPRPGRERTRRTPLAERPSPPGVSAADLRHGPQGTRRGARHGEPGSRRSGTRLRRLPDSARRATDRRRRRVRPVAGNRASTARTGRTNARTSRTMSSWPRLAYPRSGARTPTGGTGGRSASSGPG